MVAVPDAIATPATEPSPAPRPTGNPEVLSSVQRNGVPGWLAPLSPAEERLWAAFPLGEAADYSVGDEVLDDPAQGASWGEERTLRAALIAALALGALAQEPGRTAGVRIIGARIVGRMELRHGTVDVPLTLLSCRIEGDIRFDESVTRSIDLSESHLGRIRGEGAHVRGSLRMTNSTVERAPDSTWQPSRHPGLRYEEGLIHLDEITVDTDLAAFDLVSRGPVSLIGARIGGVLDLYHATIDRPQGVALNLGGAKVERQLMLGRAQIRGQVRMPSAACGGMVHFSRASITDTRGTALEAEGFTSGGDGYFQHGFHAEGGLVLVGTRFAGVLSFRGARLGAAAGRPVLHGGGMQVNRGLYLGAGFHAEGEVRLIGATIGGHLDLIGMDPDCGALTLYHASVGTIRDAGPATWPREVLLDGLSYDAFDPYLPARERMSLLRKQRDGYRAQPYEFLAAYYRALGHDEDARAVLLEKEKSRRAGGRLVERLVGRAFGGLVGYGYRPMRAVLYGLVVQVAASCFFALDRPTQIDPVQHVAFYPVLYTADLFVPIVHFGQSDEFQSHGLAAVVAMVLPYLGWALGLAIVAGVSRTLTRGLGERQ